MRGICALMVFSGHVTGAYNIPWFQAHTHHPLHLLIDGSAAVIFFFVLSGYFYYTPKFLTVKSYTHLIIKRVTHLLPPYWISIIAGALLCNYYLSNGISQEHNVTSWFKSFWNEPVSLQKFLVEAKVVLRGGSSKEFINPASWYLNADFKMMIIIPILVWMMNKTRWWLVLPLIILSLISTIQYWIAIFLMGATFHHYQDRVFKWIGKRHWLLGLLMVIGVVLWDAPTWIEIGINIDTLRKRIEMIQAGGVILMLMGFLSFSNLPILTSRPLLFMGRISYEFYIIHFIVLLGLLPYISNTWLYITVCLAVSLATAVLLHQCGTWFTARILNTRMVQYFKEQNK